MALYHQGLMDDEDDELMEGAGHGKKLGYIGVRATDSNNPDKVQLFVSPNAAAAFAIANHTDGGDSNKQLVVGKKRSRQQQQ